MALRSPVSSNRAEVADPVTPANLSDVELARRARAEYPDSVTAYTELMRRHQASIYRFCRRLLVDAADAEDATQETMVNIYRGLATFQAKSNFKTWVYAIARNACFSQIRAATARRRAVTEYARQATTEDANSEAFTMRRDADFVMLALDWRDREILALRFVADLSFEDIARLQSLSLSAAKMRVYRAVARAKVLLGQ